MDTNKLCLNAAEVSEWTGLSLSTVRKLTRSNEIPHVKVGRRILYPTEALTSWLNQNTVCNIVPVKDGATNG